jgi:molybdopterin molybdotransferase
MRAEDTADWLSPGEALARIMAAVSPLPAVERDLLDCGGWVLAEDVAAEVDLPPWHNSAMDGFAVRSAEVAGASREHPVRLRVVDDIPAGGFPSVSLGSGEAARIMTGAPVPDGCDGVVRVEHTDGGSGIGTATAWVEVLSDADAGRNVRPAGGDVPRGAVPLRPGDPLTPGRIALAAALGRPRLRVVGRPTVALLTSGDELVEVDDFDQVRAGRRIVSSNSYGLAAHLTEIGCAVRMLGIARDTPESLREHLERARGCDALITSAGVSVGEHDHVRRVLAEMGAEIDFWRMRARPGSALAFGTVAGLDGIPWFGLPGNPVSTLACFELFARPALLRMAGHADAYAPTRDAILSDPYPATGASTHFARVRLDARGVASLTRSQSSGAASAMAEADALAILPPGPERDGGSRVSVIVLGGAPRSDRAPFQG